MSNAASWLNCTAHYWLSRMKMLKLTASGCIDGTRLIIRAGCHRGPLLEMVIFNLLLLVGSGLMMFNSETLTTIILLEVFSQSSEATYITITAQVLSEDFHGRILPYYIIGSIPILFMITILSG